MTVPPAEQNVKVPAWLNDPIYYHNRGNTTFRGESARPAATSSGLDDLMTEHPRVVDGMIEIFGSWIDRFGVDGFRIDTARHVNPEFWQAFVPAMLERAQGEGHPQLPHLRRSRRRRHGSPAQLAEHTRRDKLPQRARFRVRAWRRSRRVAGSKAPTESGASCLRARTSSTRAEMPAALQLPTFLGNHDAGRFSMFVRKALPKASDEEHARRASRSGMC